MFSVLICGAKGKMGRKVYECIANNKNLKASCGIDILCDFSLIDFPIYDNYDIIEKKVDGIIDFSSPKGITKTLNYAIKNHLPLCICTTGFSKTAESQIKTASKKIPIFYSANMSVGINALCLTLQKLSKMLLDFDIDIIEKHHKEKIDAPSGTALLLSKCIENKKVTFHSIRAGNIVGEHQVVFSGENESITITHQATDRKIFAYGAIKALLFIMKKEKGLYDMRDLLKG